MNSQSSNKIYKNPNIISSLDHQLKKINYQNKVPCLSYLNQNQDNQKNIQYFPIATKESFTGQHTLYLAAEGDININDYETNNEYNSDKNNIKNKNTNTNLYILPQRTIDVEIKKTKFEHLSVKNEAKNRTNKIKNNLDDLYTNKAEETKNCNYQNIKNNFISTTKNLFELSKDKKNKELVHSLSVENYSDNILNKSLSNIYENLEKLENSKIMDENFIISIKDSKRKNNLLKAIERYKRFKSLGKLNIKDPLNNSFTYGINLNQKRLKSIERFYGSKNNYNIIEEDENENSENDTINKNSNSKINENIEIDKKKNNRNEKEIYKDIKENIKENMEEIEMKNEKIKKIKNIGNLRKLNKNLKINSIKNKKMGKVTKNNNNKKISHNNKNEFKDINKAINNYLDKINNRAQVNGLIINNILNKNGYNNIKKNDLVDNINYKEDNQNNNLNLPYNEKNNLIDHQNDTKKNIRKSLKDEIKIKFNNNDKKEINNLNININNNISNNISINNTINNTFNNNININNKINNNYNIESNINYNQLIINKAPEFLVRKNLKKEFYVIGENGKEKILKINQPSKKNYIKKNLVISDKNPNNLVKNNYTNTEDEIVKRERYHRRNNKIFLPEKKIENKNESSQRYFQNKEDFSYNILEKFSNDNDKIKKNYTLLSPANRLLQSKTTNNSQKKYTFQKINISKINNPVKIKKLDKMMVNKIYNNSAANKSKYRHFNLNNKFNNNIYMQTGKKIPVFSQYKNYRSDQRKKRIDNSNHSYHEICYVNGINSNGISKTIYHDYSIIDKRLISNSTKYMNNIEKAFNINGKILNRNYSFNNIQKPICRNTKNIILDDNYDKYTHESIKIKKFNNKQNIDNNYIFNEINNENNNKFSRNVKIPENKANYYLRDKAYYNQNYTTRYINTLASRNHKNYNINKYSNGAENLCQRNYSNSRIHRINPLIKNCNFNPNYTFQNEDRKFNI